MNYPKKCILSKGHSVCKWRRGASMEVVGRGSLEIILEKIPNILDFLDLIFYIFIRIVNFELRILRENRSHTSCCALPHSIVCEKCTLSKIHSMMQSVVLRYSSRKKS